MDIQALATQLDEAARRAESVDQLSHTESFSIDDAYAIQAAAIARRYARGERLAGIKMGFTSRAKMEQMGVHDMIWGRLTDAMFLENGGVLPFGQYIHPRAEPEICFRVSQTIDRPIGAAEVRDFIDAVAPAIEIIDSRYRNFKFSLEDVVADNCSSAAFVVGPWQSPDQPIGALAMVLEFDDQPVQTGSSAAILGDPWASVVAAARLAAQYGQAIPAGAYLLAGAATEAVFLAPGQRVRALVEQLGEVGFTVG